MSRRLTGFGFCFCATLLFVTYYLGATIAASSGRYDDVLFERLVEDTFAWLLPIFAGIFLITGIIYLFIAETRKDK